MPISYDEAQRAAQAAHARAQEIGIRISCAVVDEGGFLQLLARMDGAPPLSAQVAECKAVGSAMLHREGEEIARLHQDRPGFFAAADRLGRVPFIPGAGSRLLKRGGGILGAIGISGGKPEQDVDCADAGLRAAALGAA